jgi:hypothetical protein
VQLLRVPIWVCHDGGKTEEWLSDSKVIIPTVPDPPTKLAIKNPEIPHLNNYTKGAPTEFWRKFPKNFEKKLKTSVNIKKLKTLFKNVGFSGHYRKEWLLKRLSDACRVLHNKI